MQDRFTSQQVIALTGITPRQLQWWDERGVVKPEREGHRRLYSLNTSPKSPSSANSAARDSRCRESAKSCAFWSANSASVWPRPSTATPTFTC